MVERDYSAALEFFTRSANLGSADGMVNAGVMNLRGHGLQHANVSAAHQWFLKGAAQVDTNNHICDMFNRNQLQDWFYL